jgi:hypothetical protein
MLIRIRQCRSFRRVNTKVLQLALTAAKSVDNLPQRVRSSELAKQHAHKLTPAGKAFRAALRVVFFDHCMKLHPREQLQQLAKYATKYIHGEPSFGFSRSSQNFYTKSGLTF